MEKAIDRLVLQRSAEFLNRINSDASYARRFVQDPAAALIEIFPQIEALHSDDINIVLETYLKNTAKHLSEIAGNGPEFLPGGVVARVRMLGETIISSVTAATFLSYLVSGDVPSIRSSIPDVTPE